MTSAALIHWLARTSLEASLLILAVLGLRLMLGTRLSPAWRIGLWMLVGMKLILPAFIPAGFGIGGWFQPDASEARSASMALAYSPVLPSASQATAPTISPTAPIQEMASGLSTHSRSSISIPQILLAAWLTGAITVFSIAILRQRRFAAFLRRRPRATSPRLTSHLSHLTSLLSLPSPEIILTPPGTTPALVGLSQPQILLPEDWESRFDDRSLRHVVLHELLHVKQHDLLWNWAATAVQALHWFNPLVWFVVSRFQADRELRCDAGALAILEPSERLEYGHTLLRIQETSFAPPAIAGLAPCVRHHPTLRQRILMIATPTTRQPVLQALLVLTLSGLVCYSFTTARAAEKEVPPKVREGDAVQKPADKSTQSDKSDSANRDGGAKKPGMGDGERAGKTGVRDGDKPRTGEGDGGTKKPGMGDGERAGKTGPRDGDKPRTGERDGDKPRTGTRDGEGTKKPGMGDGERAGKTGVRDGDKPRTGEGDGGTKKPGMGDGERAGKTGPRDGDKPRTGERDGDKPRTGTRDGEGTKKPGMGDGERAGKTGARDGDKPRTGEREGEGSRKPGAREGDRATASSETLTLKVIKNGDAVMVGDEEVAMGRLRGHLSTFLPNHPGARIEVTGDDDVPLKALHNTVDAVRDNGNKNVGIKSE